MPSIGLFGTEEWRTSLLGSSVALRGRTLPYKECAGELLYPQCNVLLLLNVNKYEDAHAVKIVVTMVSVNYKVTLQIPKHIKFHTKYRLHKGTHKKAKHLEMARKKWCLAARMSAEQLTGASLGGGDADAADAGGHETATRIFADISISRSSKKFQIMKTTVVERAREEGDLVHVSRTTDSGNGKCI